MTTINTADDLLTLLRENQEFREAARQAILTEELLALPAMFNAFVSEMRDFVSEMRSYTKVTDERLERLEERQQKLEEGQLRLERGQHGHTNDIGMLKGIALETKLYNRGVALIATLLRVRNGQRVRVAEMDDNSAEFNNAVLQVLESDVLTEAEYDRILDTDMIVSGIRQGSSNLIYTAIETSYTASRADIYKVKETAAILGKVFDDVEIHAALYCVNISSIIEDEAAQQGVHLIRTRISVG